MSNTRLTAGGGVKVVETAHDAGIAVITDVARPVADQLRAAGRDGAEIVRFYGGLAQQLACDMAVQLSPVAARVILETALQHVAEHDLQANDQQQQADAAAAQGQVH